MRRCKSGIGGLVPQQLSILGLSCIMGSITCHLLLGSLWSPTSA